MKNALLIIPVALIISLGSRAAMAQDDPADYEVVLPDAAQACVLPAAPDAIPEDADTETLLAAKADVGEFQGELTAYRDCLAEAEQGDITPGNKQAIVASYNYSVEMEERVANRFNEAVRAYKERQSGG